MRRLPLLTTALTLSLTAALLSAAPIRVGGSVRTADGGAVAEAAVELRPLLSNYDRGRRTLAGQSRQVGFQIRRQRTSPRQFLSPQTRAPVHFQQQYIYLAGTCKWLHHPWLYY